MKTYTCFCTDFEVKSLNICGKNVSYQSCIKDKTCAEYTSSISLIVVYIIKQESLLCFPRGGM